MSDRNDQIRQMAARGMSAGEIARATGLTRDTIGGVCRHYGFRLQGRAPRPKAVIHLNPRSKFNDHWLE